MPAFFTVTPLGAGIGGLDGALTFGLIALRDAELAIEHQIGLRHSH